MNKNLATAISIIVLFAESLLFIPVYVGTFGDNIVVKKTPGAFDLDCGNYDWNTVTPMDKALRFGDKVDRHLLTWLTYGKIWNATRRIYPHIQVVCASYVALGLFVMGLWVYSGSGLMLGALSILIIGVSFAPWFVGSIMESRAAIFAGAALLWIAVVTIYRRVSVFNSILAAILTVPIVLASLGNAYAAPVVPIALMISGSAPYRRKAISLAVYLALTATLIFSAYQYAHTINPQTGPGAISRALRGNLTGSAEFAQTRNLTYDNVRQIAGHFLIFTLAGQNKPIKRYIDIDQVWGRSKSPFLEWWESPGSRVFAIYHAVLLAVAFHGIMIRGEFGIPAVALVWIISEVLFFSYFAPWDAAPYGVQAIVPLYGLIFYGLTAIKNHAGAIAVLLFCIAVLLYFHNLAIMEMIREAAPLS